jgi:spermidine/putrescine transport system substrate-binding protein
MSIFIPQFRPNRRQLLSGAGAAVVGVTLLPYKSMAAEDKKLNLYNYDTYIGETTLADFEASTGIAPKLDLYADMDELFSKLKAGNPGYDAIVVAGDYLQRMVQAGLMSPIDQSKIPNMSNVDPTFLNQSYDPGNKYSVPYMWGTIGIGYRKSAVGDAVIDSWKVLFESDQFAGKISVLGDAQNVLGCALMYLGLPFNSTKPEDLKKVEDLLITQKKNIKVFAPDNGQDLLASGEVVACQEWSGDITQVMKEDADLSYVIPKEGSNVWTDNWAIPKDAPHPENANAFLNFILDAENGKKATTTVQYGTPNAAAKKLMDEAYQTNPAIFPPADIIAKCQRAEYVGEEATKARDEVWTKIQAA